MIYTGGINDITTKKDVVLAIGNFDGVHLGHKKIIEKCVNVAKEFGVRSGVLTFDPHPSTLIPSDLKKKKLIYPYSEKLSKLSDLGVDDIFVLKFDDAVKNLLPEQFIQNLLIKRFGIRGLVVGYNFYFGKNKSGDSKSLILFGKEYNFYCEIIEKYIFDNIDISSSKIRQLLSLGMITEANKLLGENYSISGIVQHGKRLAREFGIKTANVNLDPDNYTYPLYGVYLVQITCQNKKYFGVGNIGVKPTFKDIKRAVLEVNIFEFDEDIYNQEIKVELLRFIRPERRFDNIEQLVTQIKKDINDAHYVLKNMD
ncbi:MAG: riboflavin kinase/FMN adenylyltransferase [Candidatus Midichloriaceae bacterium]|jgi:riboflavin kinase/FMN adenylyltransferase